MERDENVRTPEGKNRVKDPGLPRREVNVQYSSVEIQSYQFYEGLYLYPDPCTLTLDLSRQRIRGMEIHRGVQVINFSSVLLN
jgi:hypothetical protein